MLRKSLLTFALFGAATVANADVLTTVKPLGFIADAITDGVTETKVLLPVSASPHDYSLKPSDVEQLQSAQLVVWIGEEMESFLEKSIEKLPKEKVLTLESVEAIKEIVEHSGEEKEEHHDHKDDHKHEHKHSHNHAHDGHSHDEDWHIWLSPKASEHIAEQIAERLSQQLPEQKAKIAENLANFKAILATKNSEIVKQLEPVKSKGYYTFHDAYGYFEDAYGLKSLGSFTINPTVAPGAKTLNAIKKNIAQNKAQCLFAEPQFTPKVIESLSKGTSAEVGQLDPLGAKIELSKNAYPEFLQSLADQFSECLNK
ncbi:zinc ABC transporter substrate-binding protein ZnuA [Glaesserella sp.]|uniref:zinc ABC transporter substrate-binding protein ZnuA n=1 Tax=Glaesserella sp. TaxID=2094731 RepID=UPI0035A06C30